MNRWQLNVTRAAGEVVLLLVRLYQVTLSPLLGGSCRFTPSCSAYMVEAVRKYGVWQGVPKGLRRILRCHPFHPGGVDPP